MKLSTFSKLSAVFLVALSITSIATAQGNAVRILEPEITNQPCSEVIFEKYGRAAVDDESSVRIDRLLFSYDGKTVTRIAAVSMGSTDVPRYTENKIYVTQSTFIGSQDVSQCMEYNLGSEFMTESPGQIADGRRPYLYSVEGQFTMAGSQIRFEGEGTSCVAGNRRRGQVSNVYVWNGRSLALTSSQIQKDVCPEDLD